MPHPCTDPLTVQLVFDLWEKTGNVAESARQLGLNRFTCYAWIRGRINLASNGPSIRASSATSSCGRRACRVGGPPRTWASG
jgi:hypothetical protein